MIGLWLLACGASSTVDSVSWDSVDDTGRCEVEVTGRLLGDDRSSPTPEAGGRVWARSADGDVIETRSSDDGQFKIPLWEGDWRLSAENAAGDCVTEEDAEVTLVACESEHVELFTELCVG